MEIVFGIHAVQALLQRNPGRVERVLVQQDKVNARVREMLQLAKKSRVKVDQVDRDELELHADGNHQGVLAICKNQKSLSEGDLDELLEKTSQPLVLVLDGVTDTHNLGACLRSADAAGVTAVVVPKDNSADLNSVVSKVASGAAETLPFIKVTNLARTLKAMQDRGLWITGTAVDETSRPLYEADLTGPRVIVMGSEGKGMRRLTQENCDELVYIPMAGEVSSLNVSVATGVCLFEVVRQRRLANT